MEKKLKLELSKDGNDFINWRIIICNKTHKVTSFSINYTSNIGGIDTPILRVDCAHGSLHKHKLYSKPSQVQKIHAEISGHLVEKLKKDFMENWRKYKKLYIKNYKE